MKINNLRFVIIIFLFAFIVRILFFIFIIDRKFPLIYGPDSWDYEIFAYNIVYNKIYSNYIKKSDEKLITNLRNAGWNANFEQLNDNIKPTMGREPGYSLFISIFFYVFGYSNFTHIF